MPLAFAHVVRDDDAKYHCAEEQHDEDPGHHRAAMPLVLTAFARLGLRVACFAMNVGFRTEHARDALRNAFRLRWRWARGAVVVSVLLDVVVLRDGGVLL
jgi:hypothetical protein